jgi:hypothetical protein
MSPRSARIAFFGAAAACLLQARLLYARMPAIVPSHFDAAGRITARMPRAAFVGGYAVLVAFMAALLTLMNVVVLNTRPALLNFPHKAYWLAPERKAESLAYLEAFGYWFGACLFVLLFDVFDQIFRVSVGLAATLEHPNRSLALFAICVAALCVAMTGRFGRVPPGA